MTFGKGAFLKSERYVSIYCSAFTEGYPTAVRYWWYECIRLWHMLARTPPWGASPVDSGSGSDQLVRVAGASELLPLVGSGVGDALC